MNARLEARLATRDKRTNQVCKVYELKIVHDQCAEAPQPSPM